RFILAGSGWQDKPITPNVRYLDHLYSAQHNVFNCSALAVLNVTRESMVKYGFSPATRVFEAAGAGTCIISDYWNGIETLFEPGKEILLAHSGDEVTEIIAGLTHARAREIGAAAMKRAQMDHTYERRAAQIDSVLSGMHSVAVK